MQDQECVVMSEYSIGKITMDEVTYTCTIQKMRSMYHRIIVDMKANNNVET
jgi:hypothetical protein